MDGIDDCLHPELLGLVHILLLPNCCGCQSVFFAQHGLHDVGALSLPARSTSRMHEHAAHTFITYCIDFLTHSPFGRAERYYFYSGTCPFS